MRCEGHLVLLAPDDLLVTLPAMSTIGRPKIRLKPVGKTSGSLSLKAGIPRVAIDDIRLRREGDSRELSAAHVVTLAESIAALGPLEPIVVDLDGYLLAGGHRLAAFQLLIAGNGEDRRRQFLGRVVGAAEVEWVVEDSKGDKTAKEPKKSLLNELADRIAAIDASDFTEKYIIRLPVIAVDTTGKGGEGLALAVEAAENSIRKQYSREEVQALARKLAKAGYTTRAGRPKTGERSARPVLEVLVGVSGRHLSRLLGTQDEAIGGKGPVELAVAALTRAANRVLIATKGRKSEKAQRLIDLAEKILKETGPI
jgi:ParB family chromosome partitioning protein